MKTASVAPKKYEAPVMVDLGEVMRGHGACSSGGSPVSGDGKCVSGNIVKGSKCVQGSGK